MVRVRQFQLSDLDRILPIEQASFQDDAWDEKLFRAFHRKCPELFLVATIRRRIAAYSITCAGSKNAELASIAVDRCHRRQGLGRDLLDHTLGELRARNIKTWWLMVDVDNQPGLRFYEQYGFERSKRVKRYYGAGRDGWRMCFTLRPEE